MLIFKGRKIGPTQLIKDNRIASMWLEGKKIWGSLSKYWKRNEKWKRNQKW